MKNILTEIDELLAHLEDFTHGTDGDAITKMRGKITEELKNSSNLPLEKTTRIEVIDHREPYTGGRVFSHSKQDNKIEGQLQDDGRTLKLFITKNR